jgi:hypothetical protein
MPPHRTTQKPPRRSPRAAAHGGPTPPPEDVFTRLARETGQPRGRVLEEWSERAAIREYLGNVPRAEAEFRAIDDVRDVFGVQKPLRFTGGIGYIPDDDNHW